MPKNLYGFFLVGVGLGLALTAYARPKYHPLVEQALRERGHVAYLN